LLPVESFTVQVGHPVEPLPDVVRAEARSAGINRPAGVGLAFQVRANKVEPTEAVSTRNLLAKDCDRALGADEMERGWP